MFDHEAGGGRIAQAGAGCESIADVGVDRIGGIEHGGNAALRNGGAATADRAFGTNRNIDMRSQPQRQT